MHTVESHNDDETIDLIAECLGSRSVSIHAGNGQGKLYVLRQAMEGPICAYDVTHHTIVPNNKKRNQLGFIITLLDVVRTDGRRVVITNEDHAERIMAKLNATV